MSTLRSEFVEMFRIALPIVAIQLGMMAMGTVDIIMVGRMAEGSDRALAAVALGHVYCQIVILSCMGILLALDPILSQAFGARDEPAAARGVQRGVVLAGLLTLVAAAFFQPARSVLFALDQPAERIGEAAGYVSANTWGILPFFVFVAFRSTLQALRRLRPILITVLLANLVNFGANWVLIYGNLGFTARGVVGAGLATSVGRWFMVASLFVLGRRELLPLLARRCAGVLDLAALLRMVRLGLPIGGQFLLEIGIFAIVNVFMGILDGSSGEGRNQAAHQITLNLASLTFMVPLGCSIAASVRVGRAIGAEEPETARRAARTALITGAGIMSIFGLAMFLWPGPIASLYTKSEPVKRVAILLIPLAGLFQVFDGIQVVSVGILRGIGDVKAPFWINVIGFWLVGLPVACVLAFSPDLGPVWWRQGFGRGAEGLWWGLVVSLGCVSILLFLRVRLRLRGDIERLRIDTPPSAH